MIAEARASLAAGLFGAPELVDARIDGIGAGRQLPRPGAADRAAMCRAG
jgi:hypothetical protein